MDSDQHLLSGVVVAFFVFVSTSSPKAIGQLKQTLHKPGWREFEFDKSRDLIPFEGGDYKDRIKIRWGVLLIFISKTI